MHKYLVNSKKSSTFARFFGKGYVCALSGGGRFPRLAGTPPGAIV